MKKLAYSIAILLAACGCSKEECAVEQSASELEGAVIFSATIEDETDTKALLAEEGYIHWDENDSISVFDASTSPTNSKFILSEGAGTRYAKFQGSCPLSDKGYYSVYPYDKTASISSTNEVTLHWDGADQKAVKSFSTTSDDGVTLDTYFIEGAPMMTYIEGLDYNLHFRTVCSYLKLTLGTKVAGITIKANTDTDVIAAEDLTLSWNDGKPIVTSVSNGTNEIHLTSSTGGSLEPGVYYIAVLPGKLTSGITMTLISSVDSSESGIWTKTGSTQSDLERCKIYKLGTFVVPSWYKLAGSGTESDPYLIEDITDLQIMEVSVAYDLGNYRTAFYKQTADIDFKGISLNPIGNAEHPFSGTYDGNSKTISNEKIVNPVSYTGIYGYREACGFFGIIKDAAIHDLTVKDPVFPAPANTNDFSFSPFAGVAYSSTDGTNVLTNCKCISTGTISFTSALLEPGTLAGRGVRYGGFIADSQSNVKLNGCVSNVNLTVTPSSYPMNIYLGGLIGVAEAVNTTSSSGMETDGHVFMDCCRNLGRLCASIEGESSCNTFIGGFIAHATDLEAFNPNVVCQLTNCVNSGGVSSNCSEGYAYAAGFVAHMESDGYSDYLPSLTNCINSGIIHAESSELSSFYHTMESGFIALNKGSKTHLSLCANCGTIEKAAPYMYSNPFVVKESASLDNCWDTYMAANIYDRYDETESVCWTYNSNKSEVVDAMNDIITSAGATALYKSWKLDGTGNLDLDF